MVLPVGADAAAETRAVPSQMAVVDHCQCLGACWSNQGIDTAAVA